VRHVPGTGEGVPPPFFFKHVRRADKFSTGVNLNRDHFHCFARNGRWGTCGDCPRDAEGHAYPEFCEHTRRYDHHLDVNMLSFHYLKTGFWVKTVADEPCPNKKSKAKL
jgi:hypothetical protein